MLNFLKYGLTLVGILSAPLVLAQVYIGEGVTIEEGATFSILGEEVIIDAEEIKGEGKITIVNPKKVVFKKENQVKDKIVVLDQSPIFLVSEKPSEVNNQKSEIEKLPVFYENLSDLLDVKLESSALKLSKSPEVPKNPEVLIIMESLRLIAPDFEEYIELNNLTHTHIKKRFLSNAELYEFEYLAEMLKPPIV